MKKSYLLMVLIVTITSVYFILPAVAQAEGDYIGAWPFNATNTIARGITNDGSNIWTVDTTADVYVYSMNGTYLSSWALNALNANPHAITTDGTNIYVTDQVDGAVYKYDMNGGYLSNWALNAGNGNPTGITTDGTTIWVADDVDAEVYNYSMAGVYGGKWALNAGNTDAEGITTNGTYFWVVDFTGDLIYKYDITGTYLSNWALTGINADSLGVTTDGYTLWVADQVDEDAYLYYLSPLAPVNKEVFSPTSVNTYTYFWVNATVLEFNGVTDLSTVDIQVNTTGDAETGTLRWTQASGLFSEVSDPSGIFRLGTGTRVNINITSDLIAFNFSMRGGTVGDCDIKVTSTDDSALTDVTIYANQFELLITHGPYVFSDTYYENGTLRVPAVNVTASGPGFTTVFNTSGGTEQVFNQTPTLFFWSIGTASRRIYSIGVENFTVTYPESVFDTYVFTVRDFTGKTALGNTYLEAWRVINGTDTLIERQIIDVHNEVPLNLVVGATYTLRIRYFDDSLFTWGQFVPGDSTIFTIVLRGVEITEQAYLVGNFLSVEITRPIPTQITVDYITSRNTTIWSNVTVIIRGGAVVATQSFNNESYTYNLGGLDADTSYTVLVEGEHTLQTEWAYSRTFDGQETYPDIPDIETIFPMAGLDGGNLIAWVFVLASGVTFSLIYRRAALIVMAAMASFFSAFGFADWNIYLLSLGWFFAIIVFLGSGER